MMAREDACFSTYPARCAPDTSPNVEAASPVPEIRQQTLLSPKAAGATPARVDRIRGAELLDRGGMLFLNGHTMPSRQQQLDGIGKVLLGNVMITPLNAE